MHGTAVVVIRTPDEIVIAADSLALDSENRPLPEPACKIGQVGSTFYVVHGMSDDSNTGYNAFSLAKQALRESGPLADKVSHFGAIIQEPLIRTLEQLRRKYPLAYQQNAIEMAPLGVIFAGIDGDDLTIYSLRFQVTSRVDEHIEVTPELRRCPGPDCPAGVAGVFVGPKSDVEEFKQRHPRYWEGDLVDIANKFIQTEIDKKVIDVGPPIDVVRITRKGAIWVARKPTCS